MLLTWKDGVTTMLALIVVGVSYAMIRGVTLPLISGYRAATLVVALMGIGMCAFGASITHTEGAKVFTNSAALLGVLAFVFIIYGLISGAQIAFMLLSGTIVLLWIIATAHHMLG